MNLERDGRRGANPMLFGNEFEMALTLPCACLRTKSLNRKKYVRRSRNSVVADRP